MAEEQNTDLTTEIEGQDHGVRLPPDPAIRKLAKRGRGEFMTVVKEHPSSSLCWALLAEGSLLSDTDAADVAAYAYARTGRDLALSSSGTLGGTAKGQWIGAICLTKVCFVASMRWPWRPSGLDLGMSPTMPTPFCGS